MLSVLSLIFFCIVVKRYSSFARPRCCSIFFLDFAKRICVPVVSCTVYLRFILSSCLTLFYLHSGVQRGIYFCAAVECQIMKKNPLVMVGGVAVALVAGLAVLRNAPQNTSNNTPPPASANGVATSANNGPKELLKVGFLPVT
jgi:hypothetical protein